MPSDICSDDGAQYGSNASSQSDSEPIGPSQTAGANQPQQTAGQRQNRKSSPSTARKGSQHIHFDTKPNELLKRYRRRQLEPPNNVKSIGEVCAGDIQDIAYENMIFLYERMMPMEIINTIELYHGPGVRLEFGCVAGRFGSAVRRLARDTGDHVQMILRRINKGRQEYNLPPVVLDGDTGVRTPTSNGVKKFTNRKNSATQEEKRARERKNKKTSAGKADTGTASTVKPESAAEAYGEGQQTGSALILGPYETAHPKPVRELGELGKTFERRINQWNYKHKAKVVDERRQIQMDRQLACDSVRPSIE